MIANEWSQTYPVTSSAASILSNALPGSLAAPPGWHSEVLDSEQTVSTNTTANTFTNYDKYETLNTADAPPIIFSSANQTNQVTNQIPSTEYIGTNSVHEENVFLNQQEQQQHQQNVTLNNNDFQQPPIVLHKTLPNNTVTYQQHVSVKYLQPPSPPPPGPIIIRKIKANYEMDSLHFPFPLIKTR